MPSLAGSSSGQKIADNIVTVCSEDLDFSQEELTFFPQGTRLCLPSSSQLSEILL